MLLSRNFLPHSFGKLFATFAFSILSLTNIIAYDRLGINNLDDDFKDTCSVAYKSIDIDKTDDSLAVAIYNPDNATVPSPQTYSDTLWTNPISGNKVHIQRLSGVDTLVVKKKSVAIPIVEALGINFGVWAYDHFLFDKNWANINGKTIKHNLKSSWILDTDSYSGNQFSHPFHGSIFYNSARYHGQTYYASALYPLIGSCVWEYFCETNEPSYNDFLSTGFGGGIIGESTYRLSDVIFDNSKRGAERFFREIIATILNPSRGVHRLFTGQMWRVSPDRGKMVEPEPFSVNVELGGRFMTEMRHKNRHKDIGYVGVALDYGEHSDKKSHHKPFDFFQMRATLNLSSDDPTFSDLYIKGRIATKQMKSENDWHFDLALYQVYKYIDNYGENGKSQRLQRPGDFPLINEACSFGGGLYMEKTGCNTSFSNDFLIDAIPFGGTTADHFMPRRYNFASGFSVNNDMRFCLNKKMIVGDEFYFARLYVWKGSAVGDPTDRNKWFWGDKGNNSVFLNKAYVFINLPYNLKLHAEHQLYYRRTNYEAYPKVHAKSQEIRVGLVYSL